MTMIIIIIIIIMKFLSKMRMFILYIFGQKFINNAVNVGVVVVITYVTRNSVCKLFRHYYFNFTYIYVDYA